MKEKQTTKALIGKEAEELLKKITKEKNGPEANKTFAALSGLAVASVIDDESLAKRLLSLVKHVRTSK